MRDAPLESIEHTMQIFAREAGRMGLELQHGLRRVESKDGFWIWSSAGC